MPMRDDAVEAFRQGLDAETLSMIDALRDIAASAHPSLTERIKWNAPSFAVGDDDRITLGLERKGGVRLVLHRGASRKDTANFTFTDSDRLATWPAPDRGVIRFNSLADIETRSTAVSSLCRRWIHVAG